MAGIFRAYDIRGVMGKGLTSNTAYIIGRGFSEGGCNILDIGLAATPMNYWANRRFTGPRA